MAQPPNSINNGQFSSANYNKDTKNDKSQEIPPPASHSSDDVQKQIASDRWTIFSSLPNILSHNGRSRIQRQPVQEGQAPLFPVSEATLVDEKLIERQLDELCDAFPNLKISKSEKAAKLAGKAIAALHIVDLFRNALSHESHFEPLLHALKTQRVTLAAPDKKTIFDVCQEINNPKSVPLLQKLRDKLCYEATEERLKFNQALREAGRLLERQLVHTGTAEGYEPLNLSVEDDYLATLPDERDQRLSRFIWNTCAGIVDKEKPRSLDKEHIANVVQGLLTKLSPEQIFTHLDGLWKYLNREQRLVANFMVKEMLRRDLHNTLKPIPERFFENNMHGLGVAGTSCNAALKQMQELKANFAKSTISHNYETLQKWLESPFCRKQHKSFEQMIQKALSFSGNKRKKQIKKIVHELKTLTLYFLKNMSVREFDNCGWAETKPNRLVTSPYLVAQGMAKNALQSFITQKLLDKRTLASEWQALIELLVSVAKSLARPSPFFGLDLGGVDTIVGALSTTITMRLDPAFQLEKDTTTTSFQAKARNSLIKLTEMTAPLRSFENERRIEESSQNFLPNFVLLKKFITPVIENNSIESCHIVGKMLWDILGHQQRLLTIPCHFRSDILALLLDRTYPSDQENYIRSMQVLPPELKLDDITDSSLLISTISRPLQADVLPPSSFKGKSFPPEFCLEKIFEWLQNLDVEKKKRAGSDLADLKKVLYDVFKLMQRHHPQKLAIKSTAELDERLDNALATPPKP